MHEQLKIRAIIHANLLCRLASSGIELSYEIVRDLERDVGKMDLPVRLDGVQAYEVFGKYVNDTMKDMDHKQWVGLDKAQAVEKLKQMYNGTDSNQICTNENQI